MITVICASIEKVLIKVSAEDHRYSEDLARVMADIPEKCRVKVAPNTWKVTGWDDKMVSDVGYLRNALKAFGPQNDGQMGQPRLI
jgi:hypothetical protein